MRKLRLAVEDLVVESFATALRARDHGTVHGNGVSIQCDTENTCGGATCGGVAEYTCALSCDTCDQYRCPTGGACGTDLDCFSNDGQCPSGVGC